MVEGMAAACTSGRDHKGGHSGGATQPALQSDDDPTDPVQHL